MSGHRRLIPHHNGVSRGSFSSIRLIGAGQEQITQKTAGIERHDFQSNTLILGSKNQIFQKNFICLAYIELRESGIENRGLFSHQTRR